MNYDFYYEYDEEVLVEDQMEFEEVHHVHEQELYL
jgi:hypothetical protein